MKLKERTTATLLIAIFMISMFTVSVMAKKVKEDYATIQDGTITYGRVTDPPTTEIIPIGYDKWGYNYQAHLFNGWYENYGRPDEVVAEGETYLVMKWSDSWLSNKDRNFDTKLDRGNDLPYTSSAAEGAWLTNHMRGTYTDGTKWTYFVKIVYPGDDAYEVAGVWYSADDMEIGPSIWGAYAIIQEFENNLGHTVFVKSPSPVGFGFYK